MGRIDELKKYLIIRQKLKEVDLEVVMHPLHSLGFAFLDNKLFRSEL